MENTTDSQLSGQNQGSECKWFVLRDLKCANAKMPAYKMLQNLGIRVFTPLKWVLTSKGGKKERFQVASIPDLLFVHSSPTVLDPIIAKTSTLQYRFVRGAAQFTPMTVRDADMERFMHAVDTCESPKFYAPGELTPNMFGRRIRIVGGPLDNYTGHLLSVRGTKVKRLIVELPSMLSVAVEVNPDYIQFI